MATAEIFEFFSGTNLLTNPARRFRPQPILPNTPDVWYVQVNAINNLNGQIRLPYLDDVTGPLYNGKTVTIVIDRIDVGFQVEIGAWDAVGNVGAPTVTVVGPILPGSGPSYTAIATWNDVLSTGFWQLILS